MISQLLAQPTHGLVSRLGRTHQVSRQTWYRWTALGRQGLEEALGKPPVSVTPGSPLPILVLSLLIETHARYRGMQASLRSLHGINLSLGKIAGIIKEAGQRAQDWLEQQPSVTPRTLALDEQDSSQRGKASLNVIDVHSGHVWASIPPVEVDGERGTLVWWSVQEQGISQVGTVSDGGRAIPQASSQVQGEASYQRNGWHLFHLAAQVQGWLDRALEAEPERLEVIGRQAEHETEGKRRRGRRPKATLSEQKALLIQLTAVTEGVRSLCQELHTVLELVVSHTKLVLSSPQRQGEIEALLGLLDELAPLALPVLQGHSEKLAKQIRLALPQTLRFARRLDAIQEQAVQALGPEAVALLAWAWQRRAVLGPTSKHLLQGVRPTWQPVASELLATWDQAVRARSAVEHWHRMVRPHVAVHRTLSVGFLSLLAVWHHHRMAPRGFHAGLSPFQRTGTTPSHSPWLTALGSSALTARPFKCVTWI
ncbi:MAG TPA: hypothetical protein VGF67_16865 [Ktedonobacteraceae bacterium]